MSDERSRPGKRVAARWAVLGGLSAAGGAVPIQVAAFHDTVGVGGGAPVHVLIVLVAAVAIGMVALSYWKPGKGKPRARPSSRTVRPSTRKRRRRSS